MSASTKAGRAWAPASRSCLAAPQLTPQNQLSQPSLNPRVLALQAEMRALEEQLGERDAAAIVQRHIRLLHTYNEIKDGAQALIGKYAVLTGKTVTGVHHELELSLTE